MSNEFPLPEVPGLVRWGIPLIAVLVATLFVLGVRFAASRTGESERQVGALSVIALVAVSAWMVATGLLAQSGTLLRFDIKPPPMALLMLVIIGGGIAIGLSRVGALLARLPLWVLVLAQGFRFPLELVMHEAAGSAVMPQQMTYTGLNYDIVTGILALLFGALLYARRLPMALVWLWNVWGSLALAVIAVVALGTSPMLRLFGHGALNTWVLHFPYVWLPAVMVLAAILGHVVVFRRLAAERAPAIGERAPKAPRDC
jgi:hypothetical protein